MDPAKAWRSVPANFDAVARIYDETRDQPSAKILKALVEELRDSKTLDVAVGTGRLAKPLQQAGLDVTGIDVSREMLSRAHSKGIINLVRGEATHLPFRDKIFDAALMVHLLHLVPQWPSLILEVARTTRLRLVSLDYRIVSGVSPRKAYLKTVKKLGFNPPAGIEPLKLAEQVKPYKMELVETTPETRSKETILEMLEKRWLAITWGVPEEIHKESVRELRDEFADPHLDICYGRFLLVWRVQDLSRAF